MNPSLRPVADDIGKLAEILLRHVGFSQTAGLEVVHSDEKQAFYHAHPRGGQKKKQRTIAGKRDEIRNNVL